MMVAGIGMKRGAPRDDILNAIDAALQLCQKRRAQLDALATLDAKSHEDGLKKASEELGLPILSIDLEALGRVAHLVKTFSKSSLAATGVQSVSEAAALAALTDGAMLLAPRSIQGAATCAIAADNSTKLGDNAS